MRAVFSFLHLFLLAHPVSWGQLSVGPRHSRLIVPDRTEFIVETPELIVDTLIMDNRSSLRFTQPSNHVVIRHAIIGKKCMWIARGSTARGISSGSMNGHSMDIEIRFGKLGSLTIDARGGVGSEGSPGTPGTAGMNGTSSTVNGVRGGGGGRGGDGGDGGHITFCYKSLGDPVVFTKGKKNAVLIQVDGGFGGSGGPGGPGGPAGVEMPSSPQYNAPTTVKEKQGMYRGSQGQPGSWGMSGRKGKPGVLKIVEIQ